MNATNLPAKRTVSVDLGARAYPIHIGWGIAGHPESYRRHLGSERVLVVTNDTIAPLHLDVLASALSAPEIEHVIIPDGERYKSLDTLALIYDALVDGGFDRNTTVLALGGGIVGDVGGFAAATYQRGIGLIQVPTTLLAMVDAAVGGKTGVNHPRGKNMIGAFHQPRGVVADPALLATLPERDYRAGLAEVIKYGLISDYGLFQWLEQHLTELLVREPATLAYVIEASCRDKARIVAQDEQESGLRALLNLGHTFGHAIETATEYTTWLHGEAVAAGLCMAARLSCREGRISASAAHRVIALVEAAALPSVPPPIPTEQFRALMAIDKKTRSGVIHLVLLEGLGNAVVTADYDPAALQAVLDDPAAPPA